MLFAAFCWRARPARERLPYIRDVRLYTICTLLVATDVAMAGGLVVSGSTPRAIGRAGVATVGDDGAGALLVNPAAIARREGYRGQLGLAFVDDELAWQSAAAGAPLARDQAGSQLAPYGAVFGSAGGWVVGLGAMTSSVSERSLRRPSDLEPEDLGAAFDFRYAGIAGGVRRDTITIGVARRIGESFAVGLALAGTQLSVTELRRVWAGFSGRDQIGSPLQDVEVAFAGEDRFVPSATAGVLVAPEDTALELGASLTWAGSARVEADVAAVGTRGGPSVSGRALATLDLDQPITGRVGARYLTDRVVVEVGGEIAFASRTAADTAWQLTGMDVVDSTGVDTPLDRVPSRASLRTHGALRGAVDVALVPGFLWATAGYAYAVAGVNQTRQSPSFGDLGGHTAALGLEATGGGFTFTVGWSRTWSVAFGPDTTLAMDNPFAAGDALVPTGRYDGSVDQVGVLLDIELDAPER